MVNIQNKLARVGSLVESGDALERDLALQILREVYAEVKFGTTEPAVIAEEVVVEEPEPEVLEIVAEEPVTEEIEEAAPEKPAMEEVVAEEPETEEVAPEEPETKVQEEAVAEQTPLVVPRPVSADVIRSLYGTEPEPRREPKREPTPVPIAQPVPEPQPEPVFAPKPMTAPTAHAPEEKPRPTLGDAMAVGHRTLGETFQKGEPDMAAAHRGAADQQGLKRSIGLNDRFLVIRDMFDGDVAAFDVAIDRLDRFTDLDDAVIWIRENFDRSADNKGMQLLVSLIERKLGR
jgi:hypothetical protein